ncbi:uncharacterized protein LOC100571908 precursor [Acyrthosiphon pisum]|uniref:ACYPI50196 protein n=1 Tax=Acyrthosiphon pisum TaxID=7029 RepID=C4WVM3_ACYPI|nr:uncharacterized protein LOC100571908 precursor [Acyrthosiphon pisum]BAH71943.1 ACYPI50196 [Acyrthosiphon pisum]|eukprot:NP_001232937.1 uncharacterized protein LOC100571908 precursor [Acyrthosiphon pisum]
MFTVVIFVLICAHAVHPSTVISGNALTNRGSDKDYAAAGAAAAGDVIAATGGIIDEGSLAAERESDTDHVLTKRGSETDHAAQGAAAAGDVMAATGGVIAAGSLSAGPFAPVLAGVGGVTAAAGGLVSVISRAADQSCREFGCHNNYCWAYCSLGNQWCYTTKGYSQSFAYVSCTRDDECNGCWKCAGSCTV